MSFRTRRFGLLRCSACGCYRTDPPPLCSDTASQHFYDDYYNQRGAEPQPPSASRTAWFWKVAQHYTRLLQPQRRAVDIGCGDGDFCAELRAAGWPTVVGIDISRPRLEWARRRHPEITFYDCPLAQTGMPWGSLDLIVMDSVIEHLPDPVGMVRELRPYMRPESHLVILTPNMESGHFRLLGPRWTGMLAAHVHIFLFTAAALTRLLELSGFCVRTFGSLHMSPYQPSEYLRRLRSGDLKGTLWRAHQESGGLYGRLVKAGPMLYAVASPLRL